MAATATASVIHTDPKAIHAGVNAVYCDFASTATVTASTSGRLIYLVKIPKDARLFDWKLFAQTGGKDSQLEVGYRRPLDEGSGTVTHTFSNSFFLAPVDMSNHTATACVVSSLGTQGVADAQLPWRASISDGVSPGDAFYYLCARHITGIASATFHLRFSAMYTMDSV